MLAPPFPLNPLSFLLFPFVGMAERPIPDETRLKPEPPGLSVEWLGNIVGLGFWGCLLLLWVLKHRFRGSFRTYPRGVLVRSMH